MMNTSRMTYLESCFPKHNYKRAAAAATGSGGKAHDAQELKGRTVFEGGVKFTSISLKNKLTLASGR